KVELAMVVSGARADLGELEAAVAALGIPQLDMNRAFSFCPRLFRAYADALGAVDRAEEAAQWRRQAPVAESALGTGDFAEPDIIDLVGDEDDKSERPRRQPDEQGARDEQADPDDQEGLEVPAGTEEAPVQEPSADQDVAGAGDPAAAPAADKQASDGND
ncbi:hypothetical protein HER39_08350, partial [Arthrobacter deserti]|nr:hypothetical protein [Arthrobacter deserti]